MLTFCGFLLLVLLFIGDIAILIKGIEDWKMKIDKKQGLKRNLWMIAFYIITPLLVILLIYAWTTL
ncbi:MAG: hypothetical protein EPN94_09060 [Nitrospirae bacterium]|nr:MAG: hypothetical protein EPN94_09060 [Nitrospirota bacterium]